jgi:tRNA1Val (adenine37-N6)-methyltransferase
VSPAGSAPLAGGVVRPARRPVHWRAPGPPPAPPPHPPELWPGPGEDLCHLAGDWRILQLVRGHRWSLDDLVTAWFAAEVTGDVPPARLADLGCGIGAVLLLLAWRFPAARALGVEAQTVSVQLARRSLAWNGVEGRCEVRHGDLRAPASLPEEATFDLVTATPPYLPVGSAHRSSRSQWAGCHLELRGGIEAYCGSASRLLAPDGWFVTCAGATQDARVRDGAVRSGLTVVRRRDVIPRAGKRALFAVWALRRAGPAAAIEPPLVVRDHAGRWTDAFRAVRGAMGMPA